MLIIAKIKFFKYNLIMSENEKKRLFIALNLPADVKARLDDLLIELAKKNNTVKWCSPESLHLTLHFLGYLDEIQEGKVKLILQSFSGKFGSFEFKLGKINAFPKLDRPRVIYLECPQINGKAVFKLQKLLGEKLSQVNLEIDQRRWQPHLTLGRVKAAGGKLIINHQALDKLMSVSFVVDTFELMESELTRQGPIYRQVISYKL